jgi:hypothetical protein
MPSPWTVGASPRAIAAMNRAITPLYGESARWRGPKMLKNRTRTVSMPYVAANACMYSSPASFAAA